MTVHPESDNRASTSLWLLLVQPMRSSWSWLAKFCKDQPLGAVGLFLVALVVVVAIVGDQTILAGDLMGRINQVMEENADKLTGTNLRQQKLQLMLLNS